jgi:hypothetical protein
MATVYSAARHVVIWLGEWPAMDTCPHSDAVWEEFCVGFLDRTTAIHKNTQNGHMFRHLLDTHTHPWYSRLWVIQEFVLARSEPLVLLGNLLVAW